MRYVSTRGRAPDLGFADVLLAGLANDGGLYVPATWPALPDLTGVHDYADIAAAVMAPFVGDDLSADTLSELCHEAYATFRHPAVVPLVQIDERQWLLELFHGPTLAFKDVALQLVGRMFDHVLAQRGQRITIVGATSGDTGSAAIDGVKHCENVDIVILYPAGRTSDVQRRQMTTVDSPNVHTVAIDGQLRRLPGPREGDVRRRRVPRRAAAVGGELDQLGASDGADRLLRVGLADACRATRRSVSRPATSATSCRAGSPAGWVRRSTTSSLRRTRTTS